MSAQPRLVPQAFSTSPTALPVLVAVGGPTPQPRRATTADAQPARRDRRAVVEHVMGIPMSVHLRAIGEADLDAPGVTAAVAAGIAQLHRIDRVFSTYRADSDISRMRRGEIGIEECDPLVTEAVAIGTEAQAQTRGAFTTFLPGDDGTIAFDPTGLVKGWAIDVASDVIAEQLASRGITRIAWCINGGGDMVTGATADLPADALPTWRVGIEDPQAVEPGRAASERSQIARIVPLTLGALATSGTAARGEHLHDPATGGPSSRRGSVTVLGPDLLWTDIWATALFVGGEDTRAAFDALGPGWERIEL